MRETPGFWNMKVDSSNGGGVGGASSVRTVGYGFGGRCFHAPLIVGVGVRVRRRRDDVGDDVRWLPRSFLQSRSATPSMISLPQALKRSRSHSGAHASELTEEALRRGLAVVCDKPFALDARGRRAHVALSKISGSFSRPYQNRRWDSDFLTVREARRRRSASARSSASSPASSASRPEPGPKRAGFGRCWTSGATSWIKPSCCSARSSTVYAEWRVRRAISTRRVRRVDASHGARSMLWASRSQAAPGLGSGSLGATPPTSSTPRWTAGAAPRRRSDAADARRSVGSRAARPVGPPPSRRGVGDGASVPGAWHTYQPTFATPCAASRHPRSRPGCIKTAQILDAADDHSHPRGRRSRPPHGLSVPMSSSTSTS